MAPRVFINQRRQLPALAILAMIAGCAQQPSSATVNTSVQQQSPPPVERTEPAPAVSAQAGTVVIEQQSAHRVLVAGNSNIGAEAIANTVAEALRRRGLQATDRPSGPQPDCIVAVWCSARTGGSWGGIPMQQVMLRYALLDAGRRTRVETGVDSASFADPTPASARQGALRKAADNVARRISVAVSRLPAPAALPPAPPPPPAPVISVAALPFRNATGRADLTGWCETLAALAAQDLTATGLYRVVERARLSEVLKEADLSAVIGQSGDALAQVGRRLEVELLLVGEVALRPDGQLAITARFVRSSDAQVERAIAANGPPARTAELEAQFRRQLPRPAVDWVTLEIEQLRQMPEAWPAAQNP